MPAGFYNIVIVDGLYAVLIDRRPFAMSANLLLLPDPDVFTQQLARALPAFRQLRWVARTESTNADLLQCARQTDVPARPWLLGAHLQDKGRGRAGRTWQNRAGANLMFSCAFDVFMPPRLLPALSPLAGVAACEGLRGLLSPAQRRHLVMKWPNDLQWGISKLAGILVEVTRSGTAKASSDHHIVIMGIGINLDDARALSQSLDRRVADWREIAQADAHAAQADPVALVVQVVQAWQQALQQVVRSGLQGFPARHAAVDALAGQSVEVIEAGRIIQTGIAAGVDDGGHLLLRTAGGVVPVVVGDISVRAH